MNITEDSSVFLESGQSSISLSRSASRQQQLVIRKAFIATYRGPANLVVSPDAEPAHRTLGCFMRCYVVVVILGISCLSSFSQSVNVTPKFKKSPSDAEVLLAKTKALYDTPFQSGTH